MACVAASLVVNLIKAYPFSLNTLMSWMVPKGENVFFINSSVMPFVKPPQYTVQLVGLLWLYTCWKQDKLTFTNLVSSSRLYRLYE